jgi:hypothetical protein
MSTIQHSDELEAIVNQFRYSLISCFTDRVDHTRFATMELVWQLIPSTFFLTKELIDRPQNIIYQKSQHSDDSLPETMRQAN